jgi:creatinine amidohydrolase
MEPDPKDLVARLSWDQVAARIETGVAAVLPIGAGAKEHGLHLPMNTDQIQAEWLAGRIAREIDALIWPTLSYGHYPAFVNYAGSVSLSAKTFKAVVSKIVTGLTGFGVRAVLVVDTGISTLRPVAEALAAVDHAGKAHHLRVHEGPRYREAVERLCEQGAGSHADEMETARMLALAPELVDMSRAAASPPGKGGAAGPLTPSDPRSANYSPSGSWGDPSLASREKGEALIAAMAEDVVEMARRAVAP